MKNTEIISFSSERKFKTLNQALHILRSVLCKAEAQLAPLQQYDDIQRAQLLSVPIDNRLCISR